MNQTLGPVLGMSRYVKTCMIDRDMNPSISPESDNGLAIETSGPGGSVALGLGDRVLGSRAIGADRPHAVELLPAVADLCRCHAVEPAAIAAVFVSIGPGSFTGLRIGVTAARMIALAIGARIVPVPTLEAIAQNALDAPDSPKRIAVLVDAKRHRAYGAAFVLQEPGLYTCVAEPVELDPAEFLATQAALEPNCAVLGPGVVPYEQVVCDSGLRALPESLFDPRAESVYALGRRLAVDETPGGFRTVVPNYIRVPTAEEKWTRRAAERGS